MVIGRYLDVFGNGKNKALALCLSFNFFAEAIQDTSTQGATLTQPLLDQHTTPPRLQFPQWVCIIFSMHGATFLSWVPKCFTNGTNTARYR